MTGTPNNTRSEDVYELARRHGLSHERALDAAAIGHFACWCGNENPCAGGAQRHVGCPLHYADGDWSWNNHYVFRDA